MFDAIEFLHGIAPRALACSRTLPVSGGVCSGIMAPCESSFWTDGAIQGLRAAALASRLARALATLRGRVGVQFRVSTAARHLVAVRHAIAFDRLEPLERD